LEITMANHSSAKRIQLTVGCALVALLGCSGEGSSNSDDLTTAALDITDALDSQTAAQTQSSDCFAEFKACKEAVGGDAKACSDTLKECLPDEAPRSRRCEVGDGGRDRDDDADEDADEASDEDIDSDERADEAASPDGGIRRGRDKGRDHGSADGGVKADHGKHHGKGHGCGRPAIAADRFRVCTASSTSNVTQGMDSAQAGTAHKACVKQAFDERIESLCEKAEKLCTRTDAQSDVCTEIAAACAKLAPATP
jgi:hypothetical protein